MTVVMKTENLTKYFGGNVGIENLTLRLNQGEIFGFLGPNGAGKTTTIRLLMNFIRANQGNMEIFGRRVNWGDYLYRKDIGFLPGELVLPQGFTGGELLNYWSDLSGTSPCFRSECLDALAFPYSDLARKTREYSSGMRQKLGIIGALQNLPRLIILDEPTAGLDPLVKHSFLHLLREIKGRGSTVFFSSHILSEVEQIADSTAIIRKGRLIIESRMEDLKRKHNKNVKIEFKSESDLQRFLEKYKCKSDRKDFTLRFIVATDGIEHLINALQGIHINNINITDPTLEDIFLQYYEYQD